MPARVLAVAILEATHLEVDRLYSPMVAHLGLGLILLAGYTTQPAAHPRMVVAAAALQEVILAMGAVEVAVTTHPLEAIACSREAAVVVATQVARLESRRVAAVAGFTSEHPAQAHAANYAFGGLFNGTLCNHRRRSRHQPRRS